MTAVTVKGLEALQRRLAAASAPEAVKATLREEAEAIAAEARARAPGKLANTIEIVDEKSRAEACLRRRHVGSGRSVHRVRHRATPGNALALAGFPSAFTGR